VVWVCTCVHTYMVVTIVVVCRCVAYEVYRLVVTYYVLCFDHFVGAGSESVAWHCLLIHSSN
jgi:hypothetical protein